MGPMPWTINSELFPLSVRGFSTGISTMTNWTSNLLISQFFLSVINAFVGLFPSDTAAAAGDKGSLRFGCSVAVSWFAGSLLTGSATQL